MFKNFKLQDGRRRPSWKSKNRDISQTVWPILLKFCTMKHINPLELTSCLRIKFKKIQDGGRPPSKNGLMRYLSNRLTNYDKIGTQCILAIPTWRETKCLKMWKSKMADGGHLEKSKKRYRPITKTIWRILIKFYMMTHINCSELTACSNIKCLKIQDGGRLPFL